MSVIQILARQKQQQLLFLGALSFGLLTMAAVPVFAVQYSDTVNNWANHDIDQLTNRGVIQGYEDGTFKPDATMTRAEFITAFKRAYNLSNADVNSLPTFRTLSTADQDRPVTRAEVLAVTSEALSSPGNIGMATVNKSVDSYSDSTEVPDWARSGINRTIQYGVYAGSPDRAGRIAPMEPATRAEIAAVLDNMMEFNQTVANANVNVVATGAAGANVNDGTIATPLYSRFNRPGDSVAVILNRELVTPDGRVLPSGTKLYGVVTDAQKATTKNDSGQLGIRLTQAITPTQQVYNINATMAAPDSQGVVNKDTLRDILTVNPTRSFSQLKAEVRSAEGGNVGTTIGKSNVYQDSVGVVAPFNELLRTADSSNDVYLGVGDQVQLKFDNPANVNNNIPETAGPKNVPEVPQNQE